MGSDEAIGLMLRLPMGREVGWASLPFLFVSLRHYFYLLVMPRNETLFLEQKQKAPKER